MIIKKFQGKTKEEALDQAFRELGNNIVEMNTRNVKKKGVFSFLMPQMVEVTVALEEEQAAPRTSQIAEAIAGVRNVAQASIINEEAVASKLDIRTPEDDLPTVKSAIELLTERKEKEKKSERVQTVDKNDSSVIEEKLDSLHTMLEAQLQKPEEEADSDGIFSKNQKESADSGSGEVEKFIKLLYNKMIDNEVNEKYANQIIDEMEKNTHPNMPFEMALANTYQKMILKFGNPVGITPSAKGPKVVFFVGPTGVGKTTTIGKLAWM